VLAHVALDDLEDLASAGGELDLGHGRTVLVFGAACQTPVRGTYVRVFVGSASFSLRSTMVLARPGAALRRQRTWRPAALGP